MRTLPNHLRVRYVHIRPTDLLGRKLPRGGFTRAVIHTQGDENNILAIGEARCCPKDNYNKKAGRKIALDRALYALEVRKAGEKLGHRGAVLAKMNGDSKMELHGEDLFVAKESAKALVGAQVDTDRVKMGFSN